MKESSWCDENELECLHKLPDVTYEKIDSVYKYIVDDR